MSSKTKTVRNKPIYGVVGMYLHKELPSVGHKWTYSFHLKGIDNLEDFPNELEKIGSKTRGTKTAGYTRRSLVSTKKFPKSISGQVSTVTTISTPFPRSGHIAFKVMKNDENLVATYFPDFCPTLNLRNPSILLSHHLELMALHHLRKEGVSRLILGDNAGNYFTKNRSDFFRQHNIHEGDTVEINRLISILENAVS